MLLGEVDSEFVDDFTGVSGEGTEELEVGGKDAVDQWDASAEDRSRACRLTVPLPSMTMKPNLESLSKSSAKASVWNLLSHKYSELHRINIVSHQYSGINAATTLFAPNLRQLTC